MPVLRSTYVSLPPRPQQKDGTHINTCVVLCSSSNIQRPLALCSNFWRQRNDGCKPEKGRNIHKNKTKFAHGRLQCSIVCIHTYGSYNMYSAHGGHRIRRIRKCRPRGTAGRAVHALAFIESTLGRAENKRRARGLSASKLDGFGLRLRDKKRSVLYVSCSIHVQGNLWRTNHAPTTTAAPHIYMYVRPVPAMMMVLCRTAC